jgi:glycosyltransferase involved in cell wall biosynthesis
MHDPLISCLTVSSNRLSLLKEAIACFRAQTYSNREMVIAVTGSQRYYNAIEDHLDYLGSSDVRLVRADPSICLGAARNLTIDAARGEYLCQWDDDDLYHPERLRIQYEALHRADADASFLTDLLQFYADESAMYWLDWTLYAPRGEDKTMLPGSMLVRRDPRLRYPESGEHAAWGEDNDYRTQVFKHLRPVGVSGRGYLYLYRYHGRNIYGREHHRILTGLAMDADFVRSRMRELRRALAGLPLPMPYTIRGRNDDPVFLYNGPVAADSLGDTPWA